jgi:integrase
MNDAIPRAPKRQTNAAARGREWLTEDEIHKIRKAAGKLGRYGHRDATMMLLCYRHGLRVSELVDLRWDQIDLQECTIFVRRRKGSKDGVHTMERDEVAALRKLGPSRRGFVFLTERNGPLSCSAFFKILVRAAKTAGLEIKVHPHMLRHSCGYALGGRDVPTRLIQEWLGHKSIQNTVRYVDVSPDRFRKAGIWQWKSQT